MTQPKFALAQPVIRLLALTTAVAIATLGVIIPAQPSTTSAESSAASQESASAASNPTASIVSLNTDQPTAAARVLERTKHVSRTSTRSSARAPQPTPAVSSSVVTAEAVTKASAAVKRVEAKAEAKRKADLKAKRLAEQKRQAKLRKQAEAKKQAEIAQRRELTAQAQQYGNGQIPASVLCTVSFAPGHLLRCDAAAAVEKMNAAFKRDFGRNLSINSSYRSYSQQVSVAASKGRLAAPPGTSNHGWGQALDLSGGINTFNSAEHQWMAVNAHHFGWVHPAWAQSGGSKPEPWHWEYGTGA